MGKLTLNLLDCITDIQHVKTTAYHEMLNDKLPFEKYERIKKHCDGILWTLKHLEDTE